MMNLEMAKKLLQTGIQKAKEKGMPCSIAIVDENGWLVALHRMDGAPIPTAEIARDKAWTAAVFRRPSSEPLFRSDRVLRLLFWVIQGFLALDSIPKTGMTDWQLSQGVCLSGRVAT